MRHPRLRPERELAEPILADLRAAGFSAESFHELRRSGREYVEAVPILVSWLKRVHEPWLKEELVRTLSVPWAAEVARLAVLDEFDRAPKDALQLRWAIGNAMEVIGDESVRDRILRIVADPQNGKARQMFVLALGKMPSPEVVHMLIGLLEDGDVAGHAAMTLGRLRAPEAAPALQVITKRGNAWIRKVATSALKQIRTSEDAP